jgi:hypothetical protein
VQGIGTPGAVVSGCWFLQATCGLRTSCMRHTPVRSSPVRPSPPLARPGKRDISAS